VARRGRLVWRSPPTRLQRGRADVGIHGAGRAEPTAPARGIPRRTNRTCRGRFPGRDNRCRTLSHHPPGLANGLISATLSRSGHPTRARV